MKKALLFSLLATLLMTSCLKDGLNDFDALNHEMVFHGTVNPTLGVPIGMGSATIFDMLQMVQMSEASMEINSNGIVTIVYDTSIRDTIDIENSKKGNHTGAKTDIVHVARNVYSGSTPIDLFENIEFLDNAEVEVDSLLVNVGAYIKAMARPGAMEAMDSFHVHVYYDSLNIDVVGKDGTLHHVYSHPDSIPIDSLIIGQYVTLFNNTDISSAINHRPTELRYSARMNIAFEAAFFGANFNENKFVADSIGITAVDVDADVKVSFPISAYINNLNYKTDIEFSPSFRLDDLTIDSSMLYIDCQNGIPLDFLLRVQFLDSTDAVMCDVLDPAYTTVAGANVVLDPATNLYVSSSPRQTLVNIPITEEVFNSLLKTRKIRLDATLNTTDTGNPARKRVSIKATDELSLRVWAKLKPNYTIDYGIGGNDDQEGQKGGLR